jgi:RNA polymerase sigma-70 factor (ECF subfamily)
VGNTHDAEDLTQEVFVRAYRSIQKFDTHRPFAPWLFTIARRAAATFYRRIRPTVEIQHETPSDAADPQKQAESRDDCDRIWSYARSLKPRYFQVLWLRYREEFSMQEISEILGTTNINTKVLLHRARSDLAKKLASTEMLTTHHLP